MHAKLTEQDLGEDVTDQVIRKDHGLVVSVRLDREDGERLLAIAKKSDRTLSQLARAALKEYIVRAETYKG